MPLYEHRCQNCGQLPEALVRSHSKAVGVRRAHCGDGRLKRRPSAWNRSSSSSLNSQTATMLR